MSICVMVKVPEGLVLAADSATTVQAGPVKEGGDSGPSGILKIYLTATKVFQIRDLPVGVLTWGGGIVSCSYGGKPFGGVREFRIRAQHQA